MIAVDANLRGSSSTGGIQEAVDSLPPEGGTVFVPAGTYLLRRSVRLRAKARLCGEGAATVLTRPAPAVGRLLASIVKGQTTFRMENAGLVQPGDQLWVRDFKQGGWHSRYVLAQEVSGDAVSGEILYGDSERSYLVEDEAWAGNHFPAVWAREAEDVSVESLAIDGGEHDWSGIHCKGDFVCSAIHFQNVMDLRVRDVTIRRWPADGVSAQGGSAIVTGCVVEDCHGSALHPGTSIGMSVWTGNICRGNEKGLLFCKNVRNTVVANNVFLGNKRHGIWGLADPDRYNVVSGNICAENGWNGIEAFKAVGNAIVGNLCRDNSAAAPGVHAGIHLEHHRDNVVAGNLCLDSKERPTQARGLAPLHPAGTNLVAGNLTLDGSMFWTTGVEQEEAIAEFEARKKAGEK